MLAIGTSLTFLLYTACTIYATPLPKQPPGLLTNPLQNDALPAISSNTTLKLMANASSPLNASEYAIRCHTSPVPVAMADYYEAVQKILIRDDAMVPLNFEIGPAPDTSFRWLGGQASIAFFSLQPLVTDEMPIILVAHVAALIADECISGEGGHAAGGYAHIGSHRGIVGVTVGSPVATFNEGYEDVMA